MSRFEIKFSVDEDNLFQEVQTIMETRWASAGDHIGDLQEFVMEAFEDEDPRKAIKNLHLLRRRLYDLDALADDLMNIMQGYVDHTERPPVQFVPEPEVQNEEG